MALTAICAKINAPIFSIKHPEAFQIAAALPIPQPSTLVGALAYCLGVHEGIGLKAYDEIKEMTVAARAKLLSEATMVSPVTLRRFRVLDKGFEGKGEGKPPAFERACASFQQGDFDAFRKFIEQELTDALYREYISFTTLKCVWILKKPLDSKLLYLLQRLGDTESLITVTEAWSAGCRLERALEFQTEYPFILSLKSLESIKGDYTVLKMCDERRQLTVYCIPCKKEVRMTSDGTKYFAFIPTKINVTLKTPIELFIVDDEILAGG